MMRNALARVLLVVFLCALARTANGHETMGTWGLGGGYLFGQRIGSDVDYPINCCLYGGHGDCQLVEENDVKVVDGGYLLSDGEFIAHYDTNVSPLGQDGEYHYYRCRHAGALSHCFFAPPRGM